MFSNSMEFCFIFFISSTMDTTRMTSYVSHMREELGDDQ